MELSCSWHGNFFSFENRTGFLPIFCSQRGNSGATCGSVWTFEQEWLPAAHIFEFLVFRWWSCLGRIRRHGTFWGVVSLGVIFDFKSPLSSQVARCLCFCLFVSLPPPVTRWFCFWVNTKECKLRWSQCWCPQDILGWYGIMGPPTEVTQLAGLQSQMWLCWYKCSYVWL